MSGPNTIEEGWEALKKALDTIQNGIGLCSPRTDEAEATLIILKTILWGIEELTQGAQPAVDEVTGKQLREYQQRMEEKNES